MRESLHDPHAEPSPETAPQGRDARGRFAKGNRAALTHGAHSRRPSLLLDSTRVEMRGAILSDLGHSDADVPRALSIIVDQFIEARLIAHSYFAFLAASGGPITTKGRQRRAVAGWATATTHVTRLAQLIGLERRARRTRQTPVEWLESLADSDQGGHDDANDQETVHAGPDASSPSVRDSATAEID